MNSRMLHPVILGLAILLTSFLLFFANFRFLLYPLVPGLNPTTGVKKFTIQGNTLFISDLHLTAGKSFTFARDLRTFVEAKHVSNVVIVGDLFDSDSDAKKILGNPASYNRTLTTLDLNDLSLQVFWISGSTTHDPVDIPNIEVNEQEVIRLGECALLMFGSQDILAYHGQDLSSVGAFAHAWDRFLSRLSMEKLWKRLAKVDERVWVVFGHTHIPGLDDESRVANCGGWQKIGFLVRPSGTGIFISDDKGVPELVQIASGGVGGRYSVSSLNQKPSLPRNFSWLIERKVAGCAWPESEDDLRALKDEGVKAVVSLTETALNPGVINRLGLEYLHSPVSGAPSMDQLKRIIRFIEGKNAESKPVLVHCAEGKGRTGTILAAYLVYHGQNAESAIQMVRQKRPGSIESLEQEDAIREFDRSLRKT